MADFDSVMAQYATTSDSNPFQTAEQAAMQDAMMAANPMLQVKQTNVAAAASQKKAAMGGGILPTFDQAYQTSVGGSTNKGANTMSEVEQDIRTLRPIQLRAKYGDRQAAALMGQANLANQAVLLDNSVSRSDGQVASDTAVDIASGFVMPALNIGAFGLGLVNDEAGVAASQGLEKLNNFIRNDLQSDELGQRRKLNEARNALDSRDSKAQQDIDLANGDSELLAGLKRFGRGAINSVSNATDDSAILGSGIANGVGTLLSGSGISKVVAKVAKEAVSVFGKTGLIKSGGPINTGLTGKELGSVVDKVAFPTTIGMMEGSSVYQQTVASSYDKLIAQGVPHDEAVERATDAGVTAFAIAFPAAVGLSKLVQGFEAAPFAKTTVRQSAGNLLREAVEEGGQSAVGRGAQNFGTKAFVDPSQDMLDQVGEQFGEGALYGMGTAGAISAPSAAGNAVVDSSKYLWGKASGAMADAAAKLEAKNEAASPLAPNKVAAEVAATQAAMPETAAAIQAGIDASSLNQEEKTEAQEFANKLTGYINFTPEDDPANFPKEHPAYSILLGSKNNVDSLGKLAAAVSTGDAANPTQTQLIAAELLQQQATFLQSVLDESPASMGKLPADHPAVQNLESIKSTLNKVMAQPAVKEALAKVAEVIAQAQTNGAIAPVTEESLATPEGQINAQNAANAIAHDPSKANLALVNAVLAHAASGKLVLTDKQQKGIDVAKGLFDTSREDFANRERLGLKTQDIVSNQIQSAEYLAQGQESAVQHATRVYNAYRANDLNAANWHLEDFRKFAQSIQNKLAALNEHLNNYRGRKSLNYLTIDQKTREMKTSNDAVGVTPTNVKSVEFMQGVAADAKMLAAVYENLKETFPELNGQELKAVVLDSRIDKPAAEVVTAFLSGNNGGKVNTSAERVKFLLENIQKGLDKAKVLLEKPTAEDSVKLKNVIEWAKKKITDIDGLMTGSISEAESTALSAALGDMNSLIERTTNVLNPTPTIKTEPTEEELDQLENMGFTPMESFEFTWEHGNVQVAFSPESEDYASSWDVYDLQEGTPGNANDSTSPLMFTTWNEAADFIESIPVLSGIRHNIVVVEKSLSNAGSPEDIEANRKFNENYFKKTLEKLNDFIKVYDKHNTDGQPNDLKPLNDLVKDTENLLDKLGEESSVDLSTATPEQKKEVRQLLKLIRETNSAKKKAVRENPASLWNALKHSMTERDLFDIFGPDWKKTRTFLRGKPGRSLVDVIAEGGLNDFLPYNLWFNGPGATQEGSFVNPEVDDAYNHIVGKLDTNNPNYLTEDTNLLLGQLDTSLQELEQALNAEDLQNALEQVEAELAKQKTNREARRLAKAAATASQATTGSDPGTSVPQATQGSVATTTPAVSTPVVDTGIVVSMNYRDGQDASHVMRPEFKGKSTMDLILSGDRTASTRNDLSGFKGLKRGDVFTVKNTYTGQKAQVRATTDPYLVSEVTAEEWSKLEGWAPSLYAKYKGKNAYQMQYELVNKPAVADPIATASVSSLVQEDETDSIEEDIEEDNSDVTPFVYTGEATGLRDIPEFSNLFGGTANRFLDAYKLPADGNPISRISVAEGALDTVAEAVSSDSKLQAMMDGSPKPGFSSLAARVYAQYVAKVGAATLNKLNENLQAWLNKKSTNKKTGITSSRLEQILKPGFINNWENGKILNLLQNDNGKLGYDSKLVEGAVLAGLQWLITSESLSSKLTDKNVAAIFGITEDEVPAGKAAEMSIGQGELNAVSALAKKIQEYWGLESNKDYPLNQVSGITGSLAAEILAAFASPVAEGGMGLLTIESFHWDTPKLDENGKQVLNKKGYPAIDRKTHNRVIINLADRLGKPENFKALQSYPDAIEQAVMVKPEQTVYLEDERPDVARTQMRNPGAKNKKQALKSIEVNQDTAYKFTHQYKLYEALAANGFGKLLQLFGFGELSKDDRANKFNKNHLVAVDGKNQSIVSAILGMDYLNEQVKARAEAVGKAPEEIGVHYAHAPSKVQRLQQIGRVTPQGDKNMRAVLSPHEAVLDLDDTRSKDYKNFLIAIAQAVGIKIHNIKPEIVLPQIQKLLDNELKPAVDVLQDWAKDMDRPIREDAADIFLQSFKDAKMEFSNLALQSLTEYALYLNAERGKGRTAFPVTLYGEADGITNGPGGARILHSTGPFTVHQLQMMRKVGYYPGQKGWTAQDQYAKDNVDTYGTVAQSTQANINGLMDTYEAASDNDGPKNQVKHMLDLMELLFEGNLSFNDKNELVIKRGAAKSPVTVTIYGAGQQGIAFKIAGIIVDGLYEKMSAVAAAKYEDSTVDAAVVMFGSQAKFDQFTNSWDALTNWYVGFNKNDSKFYLGNTKANIPRIESVDHQFAVNYTVEPKALQNLTSNVKRLFVEPMDGAIREAMGESLMTSMELIRQATQVQTIFLEDAFQSEVKRALDKKKKEDPNFQKGDFLSENELKKILDKLKYMMPKIDNGSQEYYLAGSSAAEVGDVKPFGMSLNEHFKTPAMVYGPKDLGVGGIAALNIGMVDGQMIMNFYWDGEVVGTLPVFDGINLPLDKLGEYSEKANKSIFDAWMGNAMKALSESYSAFMQDTDTGVAGIAVYKPVLFKKLASAFYGPRIKVDELDAEKMSWLRTDLSLELKKVNEKLKNAAVDVELRHLAMQDIGAGIDQMAGFSSPHWHEGTISVEGMDLEQITSVLNERMEFHREKVTKQQSKTQDISEAVSNSGLHDLATGAKVFYQQNLSFLGSQMNIPAEQKWMYNELVNSKALEGWTFITGTNEQIRAKAEQLGVAAEHLNNLEKGLTLTADKIIMFPNATSETLVHEMVHAATFSTIYQHYSGTLEGNVATSVAPTVERLEGLMNQFMELGEELPTLSTETMQQYLHARSVIHNHLNQGKNPLAQAAALNEFMAYTQSNPALIRMTKNTKVSALVRIAKEVLEVIKELIWGKRAPKVGGDMFTNVRFNTALLARYQPSVGQTVSAANAALAHTAAAVSNPRLQELRDYFLKKIPDHLTTPVDRNNFGTAAANIHATSVAAQAAITAAQHGFRMNHLEDSTFTSIVHALATQAAIDPNSMARAQDLFALATKKLEIADFIDPTNTDSASALYYAKEQYELVMGEYQRGTDKLGRSTLLPVFLGLAMVNNHFRSVLSKLELPKSKLKEWNSADNAFENLGKMGLDALSSRLTGEGKHAPNVQAALDALTNHLLDTAQDDLSLAEQTMGKIGTKAGAVNDWVVGNVKKVSGVTTKWAKGVIADSTQGKYKKALAHAAEITAGIVNEDTANGVAEGITSVMNRLDGFKTLREMLSDIIGRTENTAELYDANKVVRSMVSQDRQHYRDGLPEIIRSKFSRDVTDVEMTAMFHGLGKTDIAVLRESMKDAEIRELFTKASALPVAIRAVETQLKATDPKHWNQVEKKARQLAGFMNGKGAGTNLLRNAEAVSGLFSEKVDPKRVKPDDAFIKTVDKLITLYALDDMNEVHRNNLSSLVQEEAAGVDFVMAYLTGQRAEEMRKAQASPTARENYFKGYVPSEQDGGVSLIVANDSEFSKLALKSFTNVAAYNGSSLIGGEPKSYYFAKVPGRAPYNQGTMQNVRQTAGGIDLATGFTDGLMVAGRITDPRLVFKLAQNMANERATNEPLMPIYSNGVVIAFERAVDPLQLERLKQSTDLAKMIGVWRGRQVEEAKVQVFNEALVDAAKRLHKADVQAGRGAEYINVFDTKEQKKDPVLADAVRLLNPETLEYLENVFGKDNFPIRKDMLNDMLGYRNATIGDMWTGNHRWSPETENAVKNIAISVFGNKAYQYAVNNEKMLQNVVSSAKTLIVMKSIVIPVANLIGNMYQLISRGVPHMAILRGLPRKTLEIDNYAKSRAREVEAEAELRAAVGDDVATRRLTTELQSIKDSHARMSIWPLIQAGQFSAISDMGVSRDEVNLTEGKLHDYLEGFVDKLPESVRNMGRYAVITKDTALFRGLQKSVDYGDFIAKAVLFDHLTKQKGMTNTEALARITEEFVNYDKLPGRTRGYLENMGLLWFYNFKLRLVKVALSTIRNNPVHALMVGMAPKPTFFGSIGTPISDNFLTMGVNGELGNSVGLGMALNAPTLNPYINAFN